MDSNIEKKINQKLELLKLRLKEYNNKMKEIELALKWFEMNDISAYNTDEDLYVEVNNDTTIHISNAEISYRADLYKEHYEN